MCGIAGIYHYSEDLPVDRSTLKRMTDAIAHRGPNDEGFHIDRHIGLGHRRLSIIDIGGGHQPMCNEDKTLWTVFNGEIYNYRELTADLVSRGHRFSSKSDTEVIVHLYEEKHEEFPMNCNGMFAIALWDSRARRLILARDHLGIKPLYWCETPKGIVFASEIKAILEHPDVKVQVNEEVLPEYFTFRYVSGTNTMFRGIRRLAPGTRMIVDSNGIRIQEFWKVPTVGSPEPVNEATALENVERLLLESVQMQLVSDVPLGAYCSGGIDSSLMTAMSAPKSSRHFNTFCVGFENPDWDERPYARLTADRYHTVQREVLVREQHFTESFDKLAWNFDEPLSHPNSIPIFHLSKFAREHVVVTLTGEGADEIFLGYPRHNIVKIGSWFDRFPRFIRSSAVRALGGGSSHRAAKLATGLGLEPNDAILFNSEFNRPEVVQQLLGRELGTEWLEYRRKCLSDASTASGSLGRLQHLELRTYLVSALDRLDRMSMAVSMESRVPFLDYRLVEYVAGLPMNLKLRRFQNKYLLKRLAERYIPREIVHRRKSGFGVPMGDWFRRDQGLGLMLRHAVYESDASREYFDRDFLHRMFEAHRQGTTDHSELLWLVLSFCAWHKTFIHRSRPISA